MRENKMMSATNDESKKSRTTPHIFLDLRQRGV